MDLKLFAELKTQADSHGNPRHREAAGYYFMGLGCLALARRQGFSKALLRKACVHLMEAIRRNRGDARPYVAIAYLWLLFDDPVQAMPYLKQALQIEPGQEDAQQLLAYLQSPQKPSALPLDKPVISRADAEEAFSILDFESLAESPAEGADSTPASEKKRLRAVSQAEAQADLLLLAFEDELAQETTVPAPSQRLRPVTRELPALEPSAPPAPKRVTQALNPRRTTGELSGMEKFLKGY